MQNTEQTIEIILAEPRGFCAGVQRAIEIVEKAIAKYGPPIYVRHEIVHNEFVVSDLRKKGAIFVNEIAEIPDNAVTIFSAHGVSEQVEMEARKIRNLPVIDATCPLVTKVHNEAKKYDNDDYEIILIGHNGHPEVEGTAGRVRSQIILVEKAEDVAQIKVNNPDKLAYVTQTTLSVDDTKVIINLLKERFPNIIGPDTKDICYATQNRQNAVKEICNEVDLLLVIGAKNSSNSNRLRDLGIECGIPSYLINDENDIDVNWLSNARKIGITAGASAPEILVHNVINYLKTLADIKVTRHNGVIENIKFNLPKELRD